MLLFSTTNTERITDAVLPPRESRGKFRLLTITMKYVGFRSVAMEFEKYCAGRDDIEHVSILFDPPMWVKVLGRPIKHLPFYDYSAERSAWAWRKCIGSWFRSKIDLSRFDAVHCAHQLVGYGVLDRRPATTAVSVHIDATQMKLVEYWGDSARWARGMIKAEQEIFEKADVIAAMSEWAGESVTRHYGIDRSKVVIVPPAAEIVPRPDLESDAPREQGRKARILYVSNYWELKGGPDLWRWHQERWKDRAELHVVGDCRGPDGEGVVYHGKVPREKLLKEIVPTCDVFCLPTRRDLSPWVVAESAAAGLPVVVSNFSGIPEMVEHGKTGFLIDRSNEQGFIDAVEQLLNDRELSRRMGLAGQEMVRRKLSREVVCSRIIGALKVTAEARRREAPIPIRRGGGSPGIDALDQYLAGRKRAS